MLSRLITRRARWITACGLALLVLAGVVGAGTVNALSLNRFEAPGSESLQAREAMAARHGTGSPNLALLVTAKGGDVNAPEVAAAGAELTTRLADTPGIGDAWSYWSRDRPDTLRSRDGSSALVLAWAPGDADQVRRDLLPDLAPSLARDDAVVRVEVGGGDEVFRQVMAQARQDFLRAELIVVPLVLLLLFAVYRRWSAALVTLGAGLFAVLGSLALMRGMLPFVELSTFASNIALVMGIGLGVDYGLFMVFRYREELRAGYDVPEAVARTVRGAGRTVVFSGATVAASLSVLLVFPFPFLASFAYASVAVVLSAIFAAVVLLPAALMLLGRRVDRPSPPPERGFWHRTALRVVRRPVLYGGAALALVLALGAPFLGVEFGLPDDRVLPSSAPARQMYDKIRDGFVAEEADAVAVVAAEGTPSSQTGPYAEALARLDGVLRVDPSPDGTLLRVVFTSERLEADATGAVAEVRAVPAPFERLVGGYPAELTDYRDGVTARLPLVGGLIVLITFVILLAMTGGVIAAVKASVLNLLSLSVMFGALVFVFQDGNFAGLLGFTPTGTIEPSIPILMFCIAYGLSMDYEVLMLARVREEYDRTGDAVAAIPLGIARSAPLITAAALILAASFATYTTGGVVFLKQLGLGMALAVVVDATLIRGVLAPALLRLAGPANWWPRAPRTPSPDKDAPDVSLVA
ncbi:MMPL family transporter [Actinocorallia sp. A-T 12471]|uniref:MMPL family transporter n=1 Tax=Actinocorallia sp. A-T 12471 TaxID=3089813 RepID=UPI0029D061B0|nr:MMPL family transporter [Actinocorallia sp. A-T 12471]MDX6739161.1 MMPL family transporter [Actinocorallia sp. A-T 12471]